MTGHCWTQHIEKNDLNQLNVVCFSAKQTKTLTIAIKRSEVVCLLQLDITDSYEVSYSNLNYLFNQNMPAKNEPSVFRQHKHIK